MTLRLGRDDVILQSDIPI